MAHAILMPRPGQMTEECTLLVWRKDEGDTVQPGDVLFEIETDKAVMEVEAFDAGILLRRLVAEGETVPVNSVVAYIGEAGEDVPDVEPMSTPAAPEAMPEPAGVPVSSAPAEVASPADAGAPGVAAAAVPARGRAPASPRARRVAAELGVDLATVAGSGPRGRIVERDVRAAGAAGASGEAAANGRSAAIPSKAAPVPPADAPALADGEELVPLSRMRQVIAQRLGATTSVPHFSVTVRVDVTKVMQHRAELKATGTALTVTDFVLMACAQALVAMPVVNSWTDGASMVLRRRVHLGLAVSIPTGLVVPVIRDADHLAIGEIHAQSARLIEAARGGNLTPDEMTGSTFTVSNLGMHGVEAFNAIINPGESAILAVGAAEPMPVVMGEGIGVRTIMRVTLSADHRLIDGELAARFLADVRGRLEEPAQLLTKVTEV